MREDHQAAEGASALGVPDTIGDPRRNRFLEKYDYYRMQRRLEADAANADHFTPAAQDFIICLITIEFFIILAIQADVFWRSRWNSIVSVGRSAQQHRHVSHQ